MGASLYPCNCPRWLTSFLIAGVLIVHGVLLVWEVYGDSPTWDEVAHLPAGVRIWETGQFDLFRVNPPLARFVAALPVWLSQPRISYKSINSAPYNRSEFAVARDFIALNGPNALALYRLGRLACLAFSFLGAGICFLWARLLYGNIAGLLALTLWCFDPLILGHGHLITSDVAGAATAVTAGFTFWLWLRKFDWPQAFLAGFCLGLAQLTKTTNIILIAISPLAWLLWRNAPSSASRRRWVAEGIQLAALFSIALLVLNAGYGFAGSFERLGDYQFVSKTFCGPDPGAQGRGVPWNRFIGTWLENVPVPLPADYLTGIDMQKKELEEKRILSQLRGVVRHGGWWYYYFYALLVKEPLGTLALFALAAVAPCFFPRPPDAGRSELMLLLPALGFLAGLSLETGFTCHARYALPVLPFAFILAGRIVPAATVSRPVAAVVLVCVLATVVSSLRICPHSLSYFNEVSGGPENGPAHLLDSNIDWGQDLLYLGRWLDHHPEARPLGLAYHGTFDPKLVISKFEFVALGPGKEKAHSVECGPRPGWYALSVHLIFAAMEEPDPDAPDRQYLYFRRFTPVDRAGYSIWIYHITPTEVERVRQEMGMPPLHMPVTD